MKNSPPSAAVAMPIGRSCGAIRVRAATSTQTRKIPPSSALTGISRRNDGRVISARLAGYAIGSDHYNKPATFGELRFDATGVN